MQCDFCGEFAPVVVLRGAKDACVCDACSQLAVRLLRRQRAEKTLEMLERYVTYWHKRDPSKNKELLAMVEKRVAEMNAADAARKGA